MYDLHSLNSNLIGHTHRSLKMYTFLMFYAGLALVLGAHISDIQELQEPNDELSIVRRSAEAQEESLTGNDEEVQDAKILESKIDVDTNDSALPAEPSQGARSKRTICSQNTVPRYQGSSYQAPSYQVPSYQPSRSQIPSYQVSRNQIPSYQNQNSRYQLPAQGGGNSRRGLYPQGSYQSLGTAQYQGARNNYQGSAQYQQTRGAQCGSSRSNLGVGYPLSRKY